ncbi:hypothetical protein [Novosphingobium jiangmenense]|uniref:Uncharacterized protein n=1 Tax=Novosphingobium jiangmenense TaxID=2791981 RepID=A0ABS0HK27_9SPHN|nr:hypothetical protein [Novosphingobium jiangmenense]MBF9152621.1 hypothetical protein [Novosphingobium jiangmenense]
MSLQSNIEEKYKIKNLSEATYADREKLMKAASAGDLSKEEFIEVLKIVPDVVKIIPDFLRAVSDSMKSAGESQKAVLEVVNSLIENLKILSEKAQTEELIKEISDKTMEALKIMRDINKDNNENSRSMLTIGLLAIVGVVGVLTGKLSPGQAAKITSGKLV